MRATDETHGGGAVTPAVEGGVSGGDEIRVIAESEVVVGTEIEDFAAVFEGDAGALGGADDAFAFVEAVGLDRCEGGLEVLAVGVVHAGWG